MTFYRRFDEALLSPIAREKRKREDQKKVFFDSTESPRRSCLSDGEQTI